ncbi:MAG: class I SAM-dependent methyltransferase [Pseudomonadota bacterium]
MKTETRLLVADDWEDYALLDSGHGRKLERFGGQTVDRPDPQAFWASQTPVEAWRADAVFDAKAGDDERGQWRLNAKSAPEAWPMRWKDLRFEARRTPFRHLGVFQEHSVHWAFAQDRIRAAGRPVKVLNLFGYTGLMSLACAAAGAEVVHLDASPKSNGYGKDAQALSGLEDRTIRWIADDAMKFVAREQRRGNRYDGIVLDPPKFGRGPKNETWRFETDLPALLEGISALLSDNPLFVIATAYAVRLSYIALGQTLKDHLIGLGGALEMGEMALPQQGLQRMLPTALYARWRSGE